jgi:hypothetical protein
MLDHMVGRTAPDLEETMREPLALTCFLPAAGPLLDPAEEAATGYLEQRPERVIVRPVVSAPKKREAPPPYRPVRARPTPPRPIQVHAQPRRRVSPRSETIRTRVPDQVGIASLAMFWGVALAGSLVAIGIALTAW